MLKFTKLSEFEKHLVKSGLVSGRTAAREAASTLRHAISPSAAVRLLSRGFKNANEIAELSKGSVDLFWKGKQYIGWDGQPVNVSKQIAEGKKSGPFDDARANLMKLQLSPQEKQRSELLPFSYYTVPVLFSDIDCNAVVVAELLQRID
ncbi:hypothetical protein [Aquamicrobium soli]|uniref:Uncharacterized protein n=1 Tax=Aquamicrobium soli TaxID=1811518 RepID=A0ABV7K6V6_9HYPH